MPFDREHSVRKSSTTVALIVLCAAQAMDGVDVTVVNMALPTIEHELGFTPATLPWVINAYMVLFGGFLLLGGRAGDLLGRRRLFLAGVAGFTAASMAAGLAQDAGTLIAARGVQGLAAALVAPTTLALIASIFPAGRPRNRAMAVWGSIYAVSGALGLLLGGLLVEGPGWRWIFLVNLPIGAVLLVLGARVLPRDTSRPRRGRFDLVGAAASTVGVGLLAYTALQTDVHPWGSARTLTLLGVAGLLLGYFVIHERFVAAEPLLPLSIFRSRAVLGSNLVNVLRGSAMYAMFFFVTLYLQQVLHLSALETGLSYLPLTAVTLIAAGIAPWLMTRHGTRVTVVTGALIAAAGAALFTQMAADGSVLNDAILPSAVLSLGLGLLIVPATVAGLDRVPEDHSGAASGMLNVSLQLGGALGLALLSSAAVDTTATALAAQQPSGVALTEGFSAGFAIAAALMAAAAVAALVLFRGDDRGRKVDIKNLMTGAG